MASAPEGSVEEKEGLLSGDNFEHTPALSDSNDEGDTRENDLNRTSGNTSAVSNSRGQYQHREAIIHYNSLSVNFCLPWSNCAQAGSAQVIERDLGEQNDFWNIHVDFVWTPRGLKARADPTISGESNSNGALALVDSRINISVDELLTLRLCLDANPPSTTIYLRGGKLLGMLSFPNGPDAAMSFLTALRAHVDTITLKDEFNSGELFLLEKKQRMRRAAPSLLDNDAVPNQADEEFSSLLQDLSIREQVSSAGGSRRQRVIQRKKLTASDTGKFGIAVLSEFAKVTQAARVVGEEISVLLDEKKRRAEAERKERDRAARRRALDIYADIVASTDVERELPPRLTLDEQRGVPVSADAWRDAFDSAGTLKDPVVMKQAMFSGGVERSVRCHTWPFLLGFYPWDSSKRERDQIIVQKKAEYHSLKEHWLCLQSSAKAEDSESLAKDPAAINVDRRTRVKKAHADCLEAEEQIYKDIMRTDRQLDLYEQDNAPATLAMGTLLNVYASYDPEIAYCQGMSDFLSPIIHALGIDDESVPFWCFESLMRCMEANFRLDQSGMRSQLSKLKKLVGVMDQEVAALFEQSDPDYYSCFRWVLVRFKRELPFDSTARFWEVLWTRHVGGDDLHIFIAAGLLTAHRRQLLSLPRGAFDSLLRYVNDLSMRIDVDFAVREGELCFRKYGALIR